MIRFVKCQNLTTQPAIRPTIVNNVGNLFSVRNLSCYDYYGSGFGSWSALQDVCNLNGSSLLTVLGDEEVVFYSDIATGLG